jgi:hypothetical protein
MYWFKGKLQTVIALTGIALLAACLPACKPDVKESGPKYFDIKGYFIADIARLNKLNLNVGKTVSHNGVSQTKTVKIENWAQELDLFVGSDINKPAWKNSYRITASDDFLIYNATDPELKTREILIKRDKQKIKFIIIYNHTKNILYQNSEQLTYFPDSIYLIQKAQRIRLMGSNYYKIVGVIKK